MSRGKTAGGSSEECITPLPQANSARAGLARVCVCRVFQPLGEQLLVLLQQQELTEHHVRLKTHNQSNMMLECTPSSILHLDFDPHKQTSGQNDTGYTTTVLALTWLTSTHMDRDWYPRQAQSAVLDHIQKVCTHLVEAFVLQAPPQDLTDPRQRRDWFVPHRLAHKVPMLLTCGRHPAGTHKPEPKVSADLMWPSCSQLKT